MASPIRYAVNGDVHIAYQVSGSGAVDLVYQPSIWSNLELMREWPAWAEYRDRLASFSRLITFDMRGVGLSDRGTSHQFSSCRLMTSVPSWTRRRRAQRSCSAVHADRQRRCCLSPRTRRGCAASSSTHRAPGRCDRQQVLPLVQAPTLVLHRTGDRIVPVELGRAVAERIADARFIELDGIDHIPWMGDWEPLVDAIAEFVTGVRPAAKSNRVLATVLFTDVVGSTERAVALGDSRWTALLGDHRRLVRRRLAEFHGVERDTAGDGFMATFDGPARAIRCAEAIVRDALETELEIRTGIHTGECEVIDAGVAGVAVHVAARVSATAGPGEVWVSSTVRDLVAGSGVEFVDQGVHRLKGLPDAWHLFRVDSA
jgi:class 3 adenylate cyclase/pimeloyl-ACP methyl ester carboxylesterase